MFNNEVLAVAIGLIFIYLLYSLLATTIQELITTIFSYRGKMLERGIEQMLDGVNYKYTLRQKIANFFILKFRSEPNSSSTLYKKSKLFTANITDHPLYKRSSENSWLNKKPAYLASSTFSDILIDLFSPASNGPVLLKTISDSIKTKAADTNHSLNADAAKILNIYINQANGDLQRFKILVENWYDETMKRVTGWYKKLVFKLLLIIGLVLAILFNVNTIKIVQKLSADKTLREAMVKSASDYVKQNQTKISDNLNKPATPNPSANNSSNANKPVSVDSAKTDTTFLKAKQGLDRINKLYQESIKPQNTTLALGWGDYGFTADSLQYIKDHKVIPIHKSWYEKVGYVICQALFSPINLLGFLITALAISLGAPFWFDLLNKFINLRSSGKKPEDSSSDKSKTSTLNQKPSLNSFA